MKISNLIYFFILSISVNQEYLASINYENISFKEILLVQNDNNIRTVIVTGKGKSEDQAAMNAAQNALLIASPRYIKKRRVSLYSETSINDNLIPEESIDTYRESSYGFNQGSILSFKVTKTSIKNNVFSVVALAKVTYGLSEKEYHPLLKNPKVNSKEIGNKKIYKIGTGRSEEDAINDAIEQALLFVVGEKFSVRDKLEEIGQLSTFIKNEIEKEDLYTKETLYELNSGYSEGYIESFNKLNSFEEDGMFKVEADIVVRIKEFSSYIDEKLNPTGIKINDKK
tara:strand:- start:1450 stop:2301 length:852 start_codon:yes stop_codon:yes gene_type:complete